jgi:hypothetical protein
MQVVVQSPVVGLGGLVYALAGVAYFAGSEVEVVG